jgi:hypothetical protein
MRIVGLLACILVLLPVAAAYAQSLAAVPQQPSNGLVRVFLDCDRCDFTYIRREVTCVDYVRNREDADVHVLVTTQDTGGGGRQWTLKFIGLGPNLGQDQSLIYNSSQTATSDEIREGFTEVLKLGLVRYAATSSVAGRLRVDFDDDEDAATTPEADPWNYWVYRVGGSGDLNGEESSKGRSISGSFSANRTTDGWRMSFEGSGRYSDDEFVLDDDDDDDEDGEGGDSGRSTFLSVNRQMETSGIAVKSLTQHWSIGTMGSVESQTFRNYIVRTRAAAGIEYNFFPYSESSRRMLTFQYTLGHDYLRYREITIFDKLREQLMDQRGEIDLSLRQPWGTASAEFNFSQYLTQPTKYSLGIEGEAEVRLFKGFSVEFDAEYSRTRDQIYLPKGEASTEEILLRQRQLATGYQYFFNFGLSYSFGSIFNNIVNPRFGGGG